MAPVDPIVGLNEIYQKDDFPQKVIVGVGAYRDDMGKPYVLPCVREAEQILMDMNLDMEYTGIVSAIVLRVIHSLGYTILFCCTVLLLSPLWGTFSLFDLFTNLDCFPFSGCAFSLVRYCPLKKNSMRRLENPNSLTWHSNLCTVTIRLRSSKIVFREFRHFLVLVDFVCTVN
jgi:hypothetical protein